MRSDRSHRPATTRVCRQHENNSAIQEFDSSADLGLKPIDGADTPDPVPQSERTLHLSISDGPISNTTLKPLEITFADLSNLLSKPQIGTKDGSYFVRGPSSEAVRKDANIIRADCVILDCDSRIDIETGEVTPGAPEPNLLRDALVDMDRSHILFTTHSHGTKGHRYRVLIPAEISDAQSLAACVDHLVAELHQRGIMLAPAIENYRWSQGWFLPRIASSDAPFIALTHDEGEPLDVVAIKTRYVETQKATETHSEPLQDTKRIKDSTSPIGRFCAKYGQPTRIVRLLAKHGYRLAGTDTLNGSVAYRLIRPGSSSGIAGVRLFQGQGDGEWLTYSHHGGGDALGDGKARDVFGLFQDLEHGGNLNAALEAIREKSDQGSQFAPDDEDGIDRTSEALREILQNCIGIDPIEFEFLKRSLSSRFDLSSSAIDKAFGHVSKTSRPSWPIPPSFASLAASDTEIRAAEMTPRCIVKNLFFADLALISAPGGTGKTTLTLWESIHVILGWELYGREVISPGPVLFITAEDSREIILGRLHKVMEAMSLTLEDRAAVAAGFLVWDVAGEMSRLVEVDHAGNLTLTGLVDAIAEQARDIAPSMILIDPIVSFGPGESRVNDAEQMLVLAARRIIRVANCCVRYVTHVSQAAARSGNRDQYVSRGGTALPDGARMVAVLAAWDRNGREQPPMTLDHEPDDSVLILSLPKLSYSPRQQDVWIRRSGYAIEWASPMPPNPETEDRARVDQLENYLVSQYGQGFKYSPSTLEPEAKKMGMTRAQLRDARLRLTVEGRVVLADLPAGEKYARKQGYLHPTRLPYPAEEAGRLEAEDDN